jgi:hypothetical protein
MGETRNSYRILVGKPERDHLGNVRVDGKMLDGTIRE